jgi:hypothetical protein
MVFGTFGVSAYTYPKVKFRSAAVLPETEISSEVDLRNSVTSKPFGGYNRMGNGWKHGRVVHIFGVQLQDRIVTKQFRFHCFLTAVRFIPVSVFNFSKMVTLGLVMFSWLCF